MTGWEPDNFHEEVEVYRNSDRVWLSVRSLSTWKKNYSGLGPVELRRLRQLEENAQLKRIVADLTLDF